MEAQNQITLGSCAFVSPPSHKPLIINQLLTGGGFVWTDWGWGGVRPSASDEVVTGETTGEAGAKRRVRELEENNGTENTPSAGEEEVTTTSDAIEQGELLA